jgi:dihydrolipoamide dehydrogenase
MADSSYDLAIVGGGPGGYVAGLRAAQLGLKVACVEKRGRLGGTCLNVGCIPSKALLQSSHLFAQAGHGLGLHGITATGVALDLGVMLARKDKVVSDLTAGIEFLFKKQKVAYLKGAGQLVAGPALEVTLDGGGRERLHAKSIVIATGSEVTPLPGVAIDEQRIVSSTGALTLAKVPGRMVVIGAGYIGLELGSVWRRLGAEVTVIEYLDRILPGMDAELAKQMQRLMTKQGLAFRLGTKVTKAESGKSGVRLTVEPAKGGAAESVEADIVLVAVGRRAFTAGLGLDAVGVKTDERGRIVTGAGFSTSVAGIHAIGDVIAGPMLAHKAMEEGVALAEILAGQAGHVNYETVPGIVYTWPEAATVGKSEEDLKAAGIDYAVGKFPFNANSRARCNGEGDGFVKILADKRTDRVLGAHIVGPDAGTLIHECVMAMEFGGSAEDIGRAMHGHPTLNEAVKEAALAAGTGALHI